LKEINEKFATRDGDHIVKLSIANIIRCGFLGLQSELRVDYIQEMNFESS
jgi:hypothetical protein